MTDTVTNEYIHFIKKFLINRCYVEFCKIVNEKRHDSNVFTENLIKYKNDENIWNEIFDTNYFILKYYIYLFIEEENGFTNWTSTLYQHKQANVYLQETFQEYIDKRINMQSIGAYDYQKFILSMKDQTFKNNLIEKYNKNDMERTMKNNLIYITQLYLSEKTNTSYYFTDEEKEEMDTCIDVIPYFEYLTKKHISLFEIMNYNEADEEVEEKKISKEYSKLLEFKTLNLIGKHLFQ